MHAAILVRTAGGGLPRFEFAPCTAGEFSRWRGDTDTAAALYDSFAKGFNLDGNLPDDGFRRLIEDTRSITKVDREVAFNEVADLSILREAQRELGIKSK